MTLKAVNAVAAELGEVDVSHEANVSKVSIVGLGMATQTGVADRMFRALADEGINILAITTSQIKISALVPREQAMKALRAVHGEFELEKPPGDRASFGSQTATSLQPSPIDVVSRLQRMEDLTIDDIQLDETQGRVTVSQVPDKPGISAEIFEAVAAEDIMVDMIVQGTGRDGLASVSFTVPQDSVEAAEQIVRSVAANLECGPVTSDPQIAILSVFGIGIRTHTGVGVRMFQALSRAEINVEMVSSSEMRVNVVVAADKGPAGLKALQAAFADVKG